jgi:hypothetical protein
LKGEGLDQNPAARYVPVPIFYGIGIQNFTVFTNVFIGECVIGSDSSFE